MADDLKARLAELARTTAEKERIEAELNVARRIQASMLPNIDREPYDVVDDVARGGLIRVRKDGKVGFVDTWGKVVVEPQFDMAWDFLPNGLALVRDGERVFCIDAMGREVAGQE